MATKKANKILPSISAFFLFINSSFMAVRRLLYKPSHGG